MFQYLVICGGILYLQRVLLSISSSMGYGGKDPLTSFKILKDDHKATRAGEQEFGRPCGRSTRKATNRCCSIVWPSLSSLLRDKTCGKDESKYPQWPSISSYWKSSLHLRGASGGITPRAIGKATFEPLRASRLLRRGSRSAIRGTASLLTC
jgi:hypothetical protein